MLHTFDTAENAQAYLKSTLFNDDVVKALAPLLSAPPEVRVYSTEPASPATAFLEITPKVDAKNRAAAADVYQKYKNPFLANAPGARSKVLLMRDTDVQVLHGFDTADHANAYLKSALFTSDVVKALTPLLQAPPEVRVYSAANRQALCRCPLILDGRLLASSFWRTISNGVG